MLLYVQVGVMNSAAKKLGILGITAATLFALYEQCVVPSRCNIEEKRLQVRTSELISLQQSGTLYLSERAASLAARARRHLQACPSNLNLYLIAAANETVAGRNEAALDLYQRALEIDRRPEIYFNIGLTMLDLGLQHDAVRILGRAGMFAPQFITEIPDPIIRAEAYAIVHRREVSIQRRTHQNRP